MQNGIYGVCGSSGCSGSQQKVEIDGIIHIISETYINGKLTKTDEVEYEGKKIPFTEYLALQRDKKIEEILREI